MRTGYFTTPFERDEIAQRVGVAFLFAGHHAFDRLSHRSRFFGIEALDLLGHHRSTGLRDRTPFALEGDAVNRVAIEPQKQLDLVTAQGVVALERDVVGIERSLVPGGPVVIAGSPLCKGLRDSGEPPLRFGKRIDEGIDVTLIVVDVERGASPSPARPDAGINGCAQW